MDDAVKYLLYIASNESIEADKEALHVIAQKADGAMRDALSIFDQIVSFSGRKIGYQDVIDNLNILDYEYYFKVTESFLQASVSETLLIFDEIIDKGFDGHNFINGLASHLRDLLVSTDQATVKLLEVSESLKQRYIDQSKRCTPIFLFEALDVCNQTDLKYKESRNQRLLVELALVKLASLVSEKKKPDHQPGKPLSDISSDESSLPASETIIVDKNQKPDSYVKPEVSGGKSDQDIHKKNVVISEGVSIKNAISGNKISSPKNTDNQEDETIRVEALPEAEIESEVTGFGIEEMMNAWNHYAEGIKSDKPRLYTTLISREPFLENDFQIMVKFDNTSQLDDFAQNIKQNLLNFMRRELRNDQISIQTLLEEADNGKRKLYTPDEKYNYLLKKNPALGKLKQEFNLDFD
ncbi:MAG: hypothetical protein IH594_18155 [Bacteroidales bacterium]|nr:hypothetical protein [Bacteroidales bacterium]